jgi:hypothetical protein
LNADGEGELMGRAPIRVPAFTTPSTCGSAGWRIDYRPRFVQLGRVKLAYVTDCKR